MRHVSFYHKETGAIHPNCFFSTNERAIALNTPAGFAVIDGHLDCLSQRVDVATGKVVDYQPPSPSADHEWNAATKRWQLNAAASAKASAALAARLRIGEIEQLSTRLARQCILGINGAREALAALEAEVTQLEKYLQR